VVECLSNKFKAFSSILNTGKKEGKKEREKKRDVGRDSEILISVTPETTLRHQS
jgi:hypothetical protein